MKMETQMTREEMQAAAARRLALATWGLVPVVSAVATWTGASLVVAPLIAFIFAGLGQIALMQGGDIARLGVSQGLVGQAIAVTAALSGHPWQLDSHMLFFALLATLVALIDIRAILMAAGTIAVHHLVLSVAMPQLIYPAASLVDNVERAVLHGVIVVVETIALVLAVSVRLEADAQSETQKQELAAASSRAEQARESAEAAQTAALEQKTMAESARETAEAARREAEAEKARAVEAERAARETEADRTAQREAEERRREAVVDALRRALGRLADGDLSVSLGDDLPEEYEALRRDFNDAVARLNHALSTVTARAGDINRGSSEIAAAAQDMSERTEKQAATLAQTASSVENLTQMAKSSAEAAGEAARSAASAKEEAGRSGEIVQEAVAAMGRIEEGSSQIARINGVIEDIAFQTNLLALNAGVEAARAGEAGQGFAVVASEVRALAQRAAEAAREIGDLIRESGSQVSIGVDLVNRAGATLDGIVGAANDISHKVAEIAESASSQSRGFSEISVAVNELDEVTQRNAAMFEETTAATMSLSQTADDLKDAMAAFRTREAERFSLAAE